MTKVQEDILSELKAIRELLEAQQEKQQSRVDLLHDIRQLIGFQTEPTLNNLLGINPKKGLARLFGHK